MPILKVVALSVVQGLAELLPVSSSAHVVVAEKLMGLDPSAPSMTLLLVMLHTGTMAAVIVFFSGRWRAVLFGSAALVKRWLLLLLVATAVTGFVGEALVKVIERFWFHGSPHGEIEELFGHLELIAPALALVGVLILVAGVLRGKVVPSGDGPAALDLKRAGLIGAVQGLCLPFRGFSRSGATISTGMLAGVARRPAEEFSFALAVLLTPPVVVREVLRLARAEQADGAFGLAAAFAPSLLGAVCAFLAGLVALRWLSRWLESGRWHLFGVYCLVAAGAVLVLHEVGF
ncbi:MAG TPA: undecaprenyl-diphosphate phosphatase [Anaeromyxobacteraceae bacterium]|nr:undecaprenyl-diphosphate phosphatase [Anaeromyxobacteraceae bacterium]